MSAPLIDEREQQEDRHNPPVLQKVVIVGSNSLLALGVASLLRQASIPGIGSIVVPEGVRRGASLNASGQKFPRTGTHGDARDADSDRRRRSITVVLDDSGVGVEPALRAVSGGSPIVLVTAERHSPSDLFFALRKGVVWLIHPDQGFSGLEDALLASLRGVSGWTVEQLVTASVESSSSSANQAPRLTPRELELIVLMRSGAGNPSIANSMGVTTKTVEAMQRVLYRKLGARNRLQALQRLNDFSESER